MNPKTLLRNLGCASLLVAFGHLPAAAQSNSVQLYGTLDVGAGSYQLSGAAKMKQLNSGNLTVPFFGFKGAEDLGGGAYAVFQLESYVLPDTGTSGRFNGDPFFARTANVGLANAYGSLRLGRLVAPMYLTTAQFNPLGISFSFSPAIRNWWATGKISGDTGWNNAVGYFSETFSGWSGNVVYSMREASQDGGNLGANLKYVNGPLSLGLGGQKVKVPFSVGEQNAYIAAATYAIGPAKLWAQYGGISNSRTNAATSTNHDKIGQLGATWQIGVGTIVASYSRSSTAGASTARHDIYSAGYDYYLSKRTDVYLMGMRDKITNAAYGNSVMLGVRHNF